MERKDIVVIGSGPSGLMTSINIRNRKTTIIEKPSKDNKLAKRILISGNGRANFFNADLLSLNINDEYKFFFFDGKRNYSEEVLKYFDDNGFKYVVEDKLYYPYFKRSECLHSFLMDKIKDKEVIYGNVIKINPDSSSLTLIENGKTREIKYNDLVLAAGGRSYDRDDFSYELLDSLHVKYYPFKSMLCPIKVKEKIPSYLEKNRLKGHLYVYDKEELIYDEEGEILFKNDGLSGICIFNSTLAILDAKRKGREDFKIVFDYGKDVLVNSSVSYYPTFLKKYINEYHLEKGILTFTYKENYSFKESQASYGGILLSELDKKTLSLKKYPNIHPIGEVLDENFICGGYNIGNGLVSGYHLGEILNG